MSTIRLLRDGLVSLATRLGTSSDKGETGVYIPRSLSDMDLENALRASWIMRKTVMVPALDSTRAWRKWEGRDAERIVEVENSRRVRLRKKVFQARWLSRLYGGAGILVGTDAPNYALPLDPDREELRFLTAMPRTQLTTGDIEDDAMSEFYGVPRFYTVMTRSGPVEVHASRIVRFVGEELPPWSMTSVRNSGWGDSTLQSIYDACRNLDSTMGNIAALVFDAKTDVIKIPELTENITNERFEAALTERFTAARMLKGNHGVLLLDGEEEYDSKTYNFGGLDTIADRFMQVASGAADIPMTRLLGMSPAGMNSTGESDLLNYYDRISAAQQTEIGPELALLDQLIVRSAGLDPTDQHYVWRPLRQLTEQQKSESRQRAAETLKTLADIRIYEDDELARIGSDLFADLDVRISDVAASDPHEVSPPAPGGDNPILPPGGSLQNDEGS